MAQGAISGGNPVEDVHTRTSASGPQSQVAVIGIDGSDGVVPASTTQGLRVNVVSDSIVTGRVTIATAGTPAAFSSVSTNYKSIFVVALPTNTLRIAIGDANVNADTNNLRGIPLEPLQGISLDVSTTNVIYLDVLGDGHGISWTGIG